jgi:hypothetical protein
MGEIFPDARFLHVIRDGRDVACSLVTMDWIDPATGRELDYVQNIRNAARYWRRIEITLPICTNANGVPVPLVR